MLIWRQSPGGRWHYDARLVQSDPATIRAAIVEAWNKFLDGLDALAPDSWSIVLGYLVVEDGTITLYATTRENPGEWIDELSVMLSINDWGSRYEKIAGTAHQGAEHEDPHSEPGATSAEKFERAYKSLLRMMARSLKDALTDPALADRFAALKKRKGFAIYYVDQGEAVHLANLIHLWGQHPPKAFPAATPLAVFTSLMHKAQIYPPDCLKVDNDQVIEATFFGHEFTNKYVNILESVPDVSELCKNLRVLFLNSTKITPAGVERLKALFPDTEVRIK
jgi:hypothetical protein